MNYKLSKNQAIKVFPYSRSGLLSRAVGPTAGQKVSRADEALLIAIKQIKAEHPFWGYRRVWARLKYRLGYNRLNHKKVYRLMAKHKLLAHQTKMKAPRKPSRRKPKPSRPNEWWGIDMTKVLVNGWGWVYVVIVLDWYTKKILGYHIGLQARAKHWLEALEMAVNAACPNGSRGLGISLMSDNGSQPTAISFMRDCHVLDIKQAFTSYNNPKGNADTERVMRTFKEEFFWQKDWDDVFELTAEFKKFVAKDYNEEYPHSALKYLSPNEFERGWAERQATGVAPNQFSKVDEGFNVQGKFKTKELAVV